MATEWKEIIPADESARFERYAEMFGAMQRAAAAKAKHAKVTDRALHAKANLAARAELEVLPDLPPEAAVGMFATPRTYAALVRYSNGAGARQADRVADVRGLAVKVLGVDGKKLIPGLEDAPTQDFLAIRTPTVPMRDADEFVTLVRVAKPAALAPFRLMGNLGVGRAVTLLRQLLGGLKAPTLPLAATTYYSALPCTFGPRAIKFAFFPHERDAQPSANKAPTYLGDELAARLRDAAVRYDLKIQFYADATSTPIEDASVEWTTPWTTVARLTLPAQDVTSEAGRKLAAYVDTLSFDPWHARTDLRPLGNIMRARNHAYRVSTQTRGAAPEPTTMPTF